MKALNLTVVIVFGFRVASAYAQQPEPFRDFFEARTKASTELLSKRAITLVGKTRVFGGRYEILIYPQEGMFQVMIRENPCFTGKMRAHFSISGGMFTMTSDARSRDIADCSRVKIAVNPITKMAYEYGFDKAAGTWEGGGAPLTLERVE